MERQEYVLETIDKDLDVREKFAGINELKTSYKPIPYAQKGKDGKKKQNKKTYLDGPLAIRSSILRTDGKTDGTTADRPHYFSYFAK